MRGMLTGPSRCA